jgi:hypothetical protein
MADPKTILQLDEIGSALQYTDEFEVQRAGTTVTKRSPLSRLQTLLFGTATIGGNAAGDILTTNGTQTATNKRFTNPKLNEDVAMTRTATDLNACGGLTAARALVSDANGRVSVSSITTSILNYLSGLTGNVQNQINAINTAITGSITYSTVGTFAKSAGGSSQIQEYTESTLLTAMGFDPASYVILTPCIAQLYSLSGSSHTKLVDQAIKITEQTDNGQVHLTKIEFTSLSDGSYGYAIAVRIATRASGA